MSKFIYVYKKCDRDRLIALQYKLLKSDDANCIYVFANTDKLNFNKLDMSYILSDTLTF